MATRCGIGHYDYYDQVTATGTRRVVLGMSLGPLMNYRYHSPVRARKSHRKSRASAFQVHGKRSFRELKRGLFMPKKSGIRTIRHRRSIKRKRELESPRIPSMRETREMISSRRSKRIGKVSLLPLVDRSSRFDRFLPSLPLSPRGAAQLARVN